jgi:hypothetical protein
MSQNLKLTDLDAQFLRYEHRADGHTYHHHVDTLAEAHGVMFLCPLCFKANGGPIGTHSVLCWSRSAGTPELAQPGPGRWQMVGTGLHDLTLNGDMAGTPGQGARSVQLTGGCGWHGFVTNGEATES